LPIGATIRLERHPGSGVCHDKRRRPAAGVAHAVAGGYRAHACDAGRGQRLGMPTARRPNTARRRSSSPAGWSHSVCPDLPLESGPGSGERIDRNIFVHVYGLGMLSQVVETREASGTMALEWALAGVFPDMAGQVLASGEAEVARWVIGAIKSLRLLFLRFRSISIDALVIRTSSVITGMPLAIRVIHIHIIRILRRPRVLGVLPLGRCWCGLGYLYRLGER
jgi:hypothetical protein